MRDRSLLLSHELDKRAFMELGMTVSHVSHCRLIAPPAKLAHVRPPIIPTVPAPARRGLLLEVLRSVLTAMLQAEGKAADLVWALFLSFTPLLLGCRSLLLLRHGVLHIKANVRDLQEGHLSALINWADDGALSRLAGVGSRQEALEGLSSTARANILAERAARSASKHVMSGRIGLGVRCLERAPAAQSGSDTREKLRALHPSAPPAGTRPGGLPS